MSLLVKLGRHRLTSISVCVFTILVIQDAFKFDGSSREVALRMAKHGALASAECNLANVSGTLQLTKMNNSILIVL
jgi:hypothetical protein